MLADAGDQVPPDAKPVLARGEMLHDEKQGSSR
jgi:hypothetical protein